MTRLLLIVPVTVGLMLIPTPVAHAQLGAVGYMEAYRANRRITELTMRIDALEKRLVKLEASR